MEVVTFLVQKKRRLVKLDDVHPSSEAPLAKGVCIGGVRVVPQGQQPLAIVPSKAPTQATTLRALARLQASQVAGGEANAATAVPRTEGTTKKARGSRIESQEPQLFVPGWTCIFVNSCFRTTEKKLEWVTNALPPGSSQGYATLRPSSVM